MNDSMEKYGVYFDEKSGYYFTIFNPSPLEVWSVSTIGFIVGLISFVLYLRVSYIIFKFKSKYFANSFYTLLLYLAVADCSFLFIQLTLAYPITVIGFKNVSQKFVAACGFFAVFIYLTIPQLTILIAINRYIATCHFHKYQTIFGPKGVHSIAMLCISIALVLTSFFYSCTCFAFKASYAWEMSCSDRKLVDIVYYVGLVFWGSLSLTVPTVYIVFYCHYKWKKYKLGQSLNATVQIKKVDMKLLSQSIIISSILILVFVFFFLKNATESKFVDLSLSFVSLINGSINPYLYIFFNPDIRRRISFKSVNKISNCTVKEEVTVKRNDKKVIEENIFSLVKINCTMLQ